MASEKILDHMRQISEDFGTRECPKIFGEVITGIEETENKVYIFTGTGVYGGRKPRWYEFARRRAWKSLKQIFAQREVTK